MVEGGWTAETEGDIARDINQIIRITIFPTYKSSLIVENLNLKKINSSNHIFLFMYNSSSRYF